MTTQTGTPHAAPRAPERFGTGGRRGHGHPVVAFALAVGAPIVALALYRTLGELIAPNFFYLFLSAVFLSAWYGGVWPGVVATTLSVLLLQLFLFEPIGRIRMNGPADWVRYSSFVILCGFVVAVCEGMRRARARAEAAAEEAEAYAVQLQDQAAELEQQTDEAQVMAEELEQQVQEITELRGRVEAANERMSAILDSLAEGVVLAGPDGTVRFANPAARRLLDRVPADGGPLGFRDGRFDVQGGSPVAQALRRGAAVEGAELSVRGEGGRPLVLQVSAVPLRGDDGVAGGVVASLWDATAGRQAEDALRESEARFRAMADTAPVLIWVSDTDAKCTFFNRAWLEFTGRTMEQECGDGWEEGVHPDDLQRCLAIYHSSFQARRPFQMEYRLHRHDGEYRWLMDHGVPRFATEGAFAGFIGSCIDITERREHEEQLRFLADAGTLLASSLDYEETMRRVAHLAVPVLADYCVIDLVEEGAVRRVEAVHADPAQAELVRELLRYPPPLDAPGHPVSDVLRTGRLVVNNDVGPAALDALPDPEHRAIVQRLAPTSWLAVPLRAGQTVVGCMLLCVTGSGRRYDAADVRRAEEFGMRAGYAIENARLYARTAEASRAKSDFLAVMSHELRTPLNAILGYTDLFLAGVPAPLPPALVPQVGRVQAAGRHLRDLIEEVLTFARLEGGHEEAQPQWVDVVELARGTAAITEPLALERGLLFRLVVPPVPVHAYTDPRKVRQVLLNLLGNAVKFTDRGEVALTLETDGAHVTARVSDTGIGIAPENQERVFEPFWQADQGLARRHGGSGLGLAVARQLARVIGGELTLESEPDRGSVFTLRIAVGSAPEGAEGETAGAASGAGAA